MNAAHSLHLLLVEDTESDADLIVRSLNRAGFAVACERVETVNELRAALGRQNWDVVISDYLMPEFSAPAALAVVRETNADLPFIVVSGVMGEDLAVEMMRRGAQDYLVKGNLARLAPAVTREVGEARSRRLRRRAETALHESVARFRAMFDHAPIGIGLTDLTGRLIETNHAYQQLLGYSAEELANVPVSELMHPDDRNPVQPMLCEIREERRERFRVETRYLHHDGSVIRVQITGSAIHSPNGQPQYVLTMIEDITARHLHAQQQETLMRAEKLRALGQMAGGVAHNLNQFLGLIVGHGELLLQEIDRDSGERARYRDHLTIMIQAAQDGAAAVRRLQNFARPAQSNSGQVVDLGTLVHEVAELTAPRWRDAMQAEGRPISLEIAVEAPTTVTGQPSDLREMLTNLVFNAIDALPHGGRIHLAARGRGPWVEVDVADNGIGMSAEVRERAGEPFFTTKGTQGTGLGLAMVFGIVTQHQGEMSLTSTVGRGTTFHLRFPVARAATIQTAATLPQTNGRSLRVLVVDDVPGLSRLLVVIVEQEGHNASDASSGEQALELLGTQKFDLVISDIGMGNGMNGWDFADQVRRRYPDLPVVLATGWGAQIDEAEAKQYGIHAVLSKPYTVRSIHQLLGEFSTAP